MRVLLALLAIMLSATVASAKAPKYSEDPFGDNDFEDSPLILDVAHPTHGRGELSVFFTSSIIDKYNSHIGTTLEFEYHFLSTLGVGLSFGFVHGAYTSIVTDDAGIIGRGVEKCRDNPDACKNIAPEVPDARQVTGMLDLYAVWSPLYGKINVVSELDVNLQIYGLFGGGLNGTREPIVELKQNPPVAPSDYRLRKDKFLDNGLFSDLRAHGVGGVGLRLYLLDWLALRAEVRTIFWQETEDNFDFDEDGSSDDYLSAYWFAHIGFGFIIF